MTADPAPHPVEVAASPELPPANEPSRRYIVQRGDCLWTIAAKDTVLGDSFHWPLLYRQNRDQIVDPDMIEPKMSLKYKSSYSSSEIDSAEKMANDRPVYKPHTVETQDQTLKD